MKISVLIPTYNRKNLVCSAVDQIFLQDHSVVHEVIICDNYSEDASLPCFIEKYGLNPKVKIVQPPQKCGPLKNWKHSLQQASGTHIHWHWSDDLLISNFYKKASEIHDIYGHEVISGPVRIKHDDGFNPIFYSQGFDRAMDSLTALKHLFSGGRFPYSPAAYILPRTSVSNHFYEDIPNYNNLRPIDIAMGPDALMIAGSLLDNPSIGFCDSPVMEFKKHSDSITEKNIESFRCYHLSFAYFIAKNGYSGLSKDEQKNIFGEDIFHLFNMESNPSNLDSPVKKKKWFGFK